MVSVTSEIGNNFGDPQKDIAIKKCLNQLGAIKEELDRLGEIRQELRTELISLLDDSRPSRFRYNLDGTNYSISLRKKIEVECDESTLQSRLGYKFNYILEPHAPTLKKKFLELRPSLLSILHTCGHVTPRAVNNAIEFREIEASALKGLYSEKEKTQLHLIITSPNRR